MSIGQQVAQQVTRINDEVETQKTMMENIDGMLDDLGAERVEGGMQLETCTVQFINITPSYSDYYPSFYQTVEDGHIVVKEIIGNATSSITLLCGSMFVSTFPVNFCNLIPSDGITMYGPLAIDGFVANMIAFQVDLPAGATGTVTFDNPYD